MQTSNSQSYRDCITNTSLNAAIKTNKNSGNSSDRSLTGGFLSVLRRRRYGYKKSIQNDETDKSLNKTIEVEINRHMNSDNEGNYNS